MSVGLIYGARVKTFLTEDIDDIAREFASQDDNEYLARLVQKVLGPEVTAQVFRSPRISGVKIQKIMDYLIKWKDISTIVDVMTYGTQDYVAVPTTPTAVTANYYSRLNIYRTFNVNGGLVVPGYYVRTTAYIIAKTVTDSGKPSGEYGGLYSPVGAGGGRSHAQPGGAGAGFLVILADEVDLSATTIYVNGKPTSWEVCYTIPTYQPHDGGKGGDGSMIVLSGDSPGSGGDGNPSQSPGHGGNPGGGGGSGCGPNARGGDGGVVKLITYNTVDDMLYDLLSGVVDYWIINKLNKKVDVVRPVMECVGGAGGGGSGFDWDYINKWLWIGISGGGGGGGELIIIARRVKVGKIDASGGYSNCGCTYVGAPPGFTYYFGGGGGGGVIYVIYKESCDVASYDVSGGLGYTTGCFYSVGYVAGQNGSPGTYREIQV